ncbi:hypothetical protein [Aliiglaciecola litoralis]|uniref:Uncharacterized protein n=1 Tax=Aliiglaciecola litoralis TaxID=582857 RepID=A0ABN1LJG1_9ALTE
MECKTIGQVIGNNSYRLKALLNWAVVNQLDSSDVVVMCADRNSLAAQFALDAGLNTLHFASSGEFSRYGFWYWQACLDVGYQDVILAGDEADLILQAKVQAGFSELAHPRVSIRQRTLDSHLASAKKIGWLHCAHAQAAELLQGGEQVLTRDKPIITLTAQALNTAGQSLLNVIEKLDYQLFSSSLNLISDLNDLNTNQHYALAIPRSDSATIEKLKTILCFTDPLHYENGTAQRSELIKRYYMHILNYHSAGKSFLKHCLFSDNHVKNLDLTPTRNLYPREGGRDHCWHWTGPEKESSIQLCLPSSGYFHFRLKFDALPAGMTENKVRIFLDGQQVAYETIVESSVIEFSGNFAAHGFKENVMLVIGTENMLEIDHKRIGVAINKLEMYVPQDDLL